MIEPSYLGQAHFGIGCLAVLAGFSAFAAGALLASRYDGRMVGAAFPISLEMGFERPARSMAFNRDVLIGDLALRDIVVRTTDMGSTASIPDDHRDPNEIVVTGKSKRKPAHGIFVGTTSLSHCSSLTFDKASRQIRLSCAKPISVSGQAED